MRLENVISRREIDSRPNREGLQFTGRDISSDIFSHIGTTWEALSASQKSSGMLPVGDFGSGYSTFPAEAELREIKVIPVDLMLPHRSRQYYASVLIEFFNLRANDPMITNSTSELEAAIHEVRSRYLAVDLASIPLPYQSFSVVILHDTLPKHSASLDDFLDRELPEILRVTHGEVRIYPLKIHHAEPKADLELRHDLGADPEALADIRDYKIYSVCKSIH